MPTENDPGLKFIVEPTGCTLTAEEKERLASLRPAGIMLRSRNFLQDAPYDEWLDSYSELIDEVYQACNREHLFISIDHEGGRVIRPPEPVTRFPYAADWSTAVEPVAKAMAEELNALAINLVFAPVADIHSNPDNPVINQRAFGTTPETVGEAARRMMKVYMNSGIVPCGKHFPGHGDTAVDSHFELPVLAHSMDTLKIRELLPFMDLIGGGVPMIMTGHLMIPELDPVMPATLSASIIDNLLRTRLGFTGVTVSDGLGMKAIADRLRDDQAVWQGADAGLDLFLVAGDNVTLADALRWRDVMLTGLEHGKMCEVTFSKSLERIHSLLQATPMKAVRKLPAEIINAHQALAKTITSGATGFELNLPGFE